MSKLRVSAIVARGLDGEIIVLDSTQLSLGELNRDKPNSRNLESEIVRSSKDAQNKKENNGRAFQNLDGKVPLKREESEKNQEEKTIDDRADDMII